jgi:hypothetical protein
VLSVKSLRGKRVKEWTPIEVQICKMMLEAISATPASAGKQGLQARQFVFGQDAGV